MNSVTEAKAELTAARKAAALFGGKALKGTARQKTWAEKIRAKKLESMTQEQAVACCDPAGILTGAKFWIETRNRRGADIGEFELDRRELRDEALALRADGKADEYAAAAARYNALTAAWGFKD